MTFVDALDAVYQTVSDVGVPECWQSPCARSGAVSWGRLASSAACASGGV